MNNLEAPLTRIATALAVAIAALAPCVAEVAEGSSTPGALIALGVDGETREFPLQHTEVTVEISAFVARTIVEQTFINPFDRPIEALYTFPLGDESAVDDFEMRSGDRVIRGEIHPKQEARRIYNAAREEGRQAALLVQKRPNIFHQSIANLMPGHTIRIRIQTVELLDYTAGVYEYVFPMVVGPRYAAGGTDSDLSPPLLGPGERSGHDVDVHVVLRAGVPIANVHSPTQTVYVKQDDPSTAIVDLAENSRIPNQDFILRWSVSSETPAVGVLTHRDGLDGYVTLLVQPKGEIDVAEAAPKETVFVLDTSGSMRGVPLEMSRRFIKDALKHLGPDDSFNAVRFASGAAFFSSASVPNDRRNVSRALDWVEKMKGGGGTEMMAGLRKVLEVEEDPGRMRQVIFLTDGHIGNEDEIVRAVSRLPEDFRVFTIGIGHVVNHHLLGRMAEVGGGEYTFIPADGDRWKALERFHDWVTLPCLTDIEIDWGALPIVDFVPESKRDLFSGQTLALTGRYVGPAEGTLTVSGYVAGGYWEEQVALSLPERQPDNRALASIWARQRIKELLLDAKRSRSPDPGVRQQVLDLALKHRLMSPFTSFVAVDRDVPVNGTGVLEPVIQPVEPPAETVYATKPSTLLASAAGSASLTERVTVTSTTPVVSLETTSASTQFSDEFISDLPVPGRFYQNVLTFAPGVSDADGNGNPTVHEGRSRDFKAIVGGIANVDPLTGAWAVPVNPNSIEEMEIITAGAGVEYGRAQGGFARIAQKQGSNDVEGTFEMSLGSDLLDRDGGDAPEYGGVRAGISVAGPAIEDRLWFRLAHEGLDWEDPLDVVNTTVLQPSRGASHGDQLTWQVSPRNKLIFKLDAASKRLDSIDAGSRIDIGATRTLDQSGSTYAVRWIAPFSPRVLFETTLAVQDRESGMGPTRPDAPNRCVQDASSPLEQMFCLDVVAGGTTGAFSRRLDEDRRRTSLSSRIDTYGGRFWGAAHELKIGIQIDDERYERSLLRNPDLVRMLDASGDERLLVRAAADPRSDAVARLTAWSVYAEDRLKPRTSIAVTLGLRLDRQELDVVDFASPLTGPATTLDPAYTRAPRVANIDLSPSLNVSWTPGSREKSRLFFSARRYHDELHPALLLIELEPVTFDLSADMLVAGQIDGQPNVQLLDRDLETPFNDEWSAGYEREIFAETSLKITRIRRSYRDQLGFVDLNAGVGSPGYGEVLLVGNLRTLDDSRYVLELTRRMYRSWEMQASYTFARETDTAEPLDLLEGDLRSRTETLPGFRSSDRRHRFQASAVAITPWGFRLGGTLRWESGLPYSALESRLDSPSDPVPRLVYTTGRRNEGRNATSWTVDARIAREFSAGSGVHIELIAEVFNLFDDRTYTVYNPGHGQGTQINGINDTTRRFGRRYQIGLKIDF